MSDTDEAQDPSDTTGRLGPNSDLLLVAAAVVVSAGVLLAVDGGPLAWLVGIPFLLFWPGYAVVSALLPEKPSERTDAAPAAGAREWIDSPGWLVRDGLSLLLSAIVVAVVGVAVNWLAAIRLVPVVVALTLFTLAALAVAAVRRRQLPVGARANPLSGRSSVIRSVGSTRQARTLAVAVILLVGAVAFVGAAPPQGEAYTESYLLTESADGDLVAEDYPTTFVAGEGQPLWLGLENHEHRAVDYTVVVVAETLGPDGSVAVQQEVDRFGVELAHNESTVVERQIAPTRTGENVRLQFQVYKGDPGETAGPDQTTQLWIDVVDTAGA
ncbi:DUF1616 domain-containing protein [Halonotius terrestris]|uniref:DUF1616 domain-containing protein n=1 Tax=Halonotius terrestris TaxID=2487750 RepID=A0A8J8PD64_9EURY|nr:DUF1616 domain-containing protein [Halonotius terrestris]TQQ83098.1 DUF1616 domain-containing protein [Halonotius terrestris]